MRTNWTFHYCTECDPLPLLIRGVKCNFIKGEAFRGWIRKSNHGCCVKLITNKNVTRNEIEIKLWKLEWQKDRLLRDKLVALALKKYIDFQKSKPYPKKKE